MDYTAVVQRDGDWWIGWIVEVPGVNCQEQTREELLVSIASALEEALEFNPQEPLEFNPQEPLEAVDGDYSVEKVAIG